MKGTHSRTHRMLILSIILLLSSFIFQGCSGCAQNDAQKTPIDAPEQEAVGGHFHADGTWHADPLPEPARIDAPLPVTDIPTEPPPKLTREDLPETLPYPMTPSNRHVWDALVTEAVKDPELMQKLLPKTKERVNETVSHLANSFAQHEVKWDFQGAMWQKMAERYPNDPEVLWMHSRHLYRGDKATHAEKQAYIDLWERIKKLNNEQGISLTSGLRKTHGLSQYYVDLGQYEKAIENIHEQNDWKEALRRAGIHDRYMNHGILPRGTVIELQKIVDAERRRRERQRDAQDR